MSFRVKLRIKSVNPCYPVKPVPAQAQLPQIKTDPELLRLLYEAAKQSRPAGDYWTRRWAESPGLPDPRFNPTCMQFYPAGEPFTSWNGGVQ
jgi:hypothetical protein